MNEKLERRTNWSSTWQIERFLDLPSKQQREADRKHFCLFLERMIRRRRCVGGQSSKGQEIGQPRVQKGTVSTNQILPTSHVTQNGPIESRLASEMRGRRLQYKSMQQAIALPFFLLGLTSAHTPSQPAPARRAPLERRDGFLFFTCHRRSKQDCLSSFVLLQLLLVILCSILYVCVLPSLVGIVLHFVYITYNTYHSSLQHCNTRTRMNLDR